MGADPLTPKVGELRFGVAKVPNVFGTFHVSLN
jgi:hypothetical protein